MNRNKHYPIILYPPIIREFLDNESRNKNRRQPRAKVPLTPQTEKKLGWIEKFTKWIKRLWRQLTGSPQPQPPLPPPIISQKRKPPPSYLGARLQRLSQRLNGKVMLPKKASTAQRGVSEQAFYQFLRQYFEVNFGDEFPIPGFDHAYSADLQIVHPTGLSIDIEIDEPYDGRSKKPHHCTDQGKDQKRNAFFLKGNWVVIRFAESQVVKYPYECAVVIDQVMTEILGTPAKLAKGKSLPPVAQWNIAQAKKMAKAQFRQTYLPQFSTQRRHKRCSKSPRKR